MVRNIGKIDVIKSACLHKHVVKMKK
jgi:hypothetical protein